MQFDRNAKRAGDIEHTGNLCGIKRDAFTETVNRIDQPFGIAEYTVRYASFADMEADEESRKWFLEGLPDSIGFWRKASVMDVVSQGKADRLEKQSMATNDDSYPVPDSDGLWLNGVKIGPGA